MKRPNHQVVICVKRDIMYPSEVMKIYIIVSKVVACLAWCWETLFFHHQVSSDDIDDIQDPRYHIIAAGHSFNLYVGLQGPGRLYVLRGDVRL